MNENTIKGLDVKCGLVLKAEALPADLRKINVQSMAELKAEDVFVFRVAACNDQPDRDAEQFTLACLRGLAELYVGKTMVMDHCWSASNQIARIYGAAVEQADGVNSLVLSAYMLRNDQTASTIAAIEGGILREVSVGCRTGKATCNICGTNKRQLWCEHYPGKVYNGTKCIVQLEDPTDAYEVSFCAVPVQPKAGVVKSYGGEDNRPAPPDPKENPEAQKALAIIALEEQYF